MSDMKKINVSDLKPGMRFDKPVYIDRNNMLVGANVTIRSDDIQKLLKWGIAEIETAGKMISSPSELKLAQKAERSTTDEARKVIAEYNKLLKNRKLLIDVHRQACNAVENIYKLIKKNEKFALDDLDIALDGIISLISENNNIFLFLYGLDEGKDYLVVHSVNVTFYSMLIAMGLRLSPPRLRELGMGTLLIDAGMLKMPTYITYKQSKLTEQELNLIKTHPLHGYKLLKQLGNVKESIAIVSLQHQEQYDGRGYPRGLKGNEISEFARIAAIADSYEAQISNRSYRKKRFFYDAMRNLLSEGTNRFDPVIMRVFLSKLSVYPIGSIVQLNDGSISLVVGSIPQKPLRPLVKVIFDGNRNRMQDTLVINLLEETSLYITKALSEDEAGINLLDVL